MANPRGNPNPDIKYKNPGGRPKGSKNKFPSAIKDKVLLACAKVEASGQDLGTLAVEDAKWFFETFVKPMIPKELWVSGTDGKPFSMTINIERKSDR